MSQTVEFGIAQSRQLRRSLRTRGVGMADGKSLDRSNSPLCVHETDAKVMKIILEGGAHFAGSVVAR